MTAPGERCEHTFSPKTYTPLPLRPAHTLLAECPCCGLKGWMRHEDEPMTCPYCGRHAVIRPEATR